MKPQEFKDCTYRECKLYAQSFIFEKELKLKSEVILFENLSDKLLYNDPNIVKKPQKIRIIDRYKDLFKKEYDEMISKGMMRPTTREEQIQYMKELQEELKGGANNDRWRITNCNKS